MDWTWYFLFPGDIEAELEALSELVAAYIRDRDRSFVGAGFEALEAHVSRDPISHLEAPNWPRRLLAIRRAQEDCRFGDDAVEACIRTAAEHESDYLRRAALQYLERAVRRSGSPPAARFFIAILSSPEDADAKLLAYSALVAAYPVLSTDETRVLLRGADLPRRSPELGQYCDYGFLQRLADHLEG